MPICQSCGMPLSKPEDFGTNADGSESKEYCGFCFQNGRFTEAEAKRMAEASIPKLKRWRG